MTTQTRWKLRVDVLVQSIHQQTTRKSTNTEIIQRCDFAYI